MKKLLSILVMLAMVLSFAAASAESIVTPQASCPS